MSGTAAGWRLDRPGQWTGPHAFTVERERVVAYAFVRSASLPGMQVTGIAFETVPSNGHVAIKDGPAHAA